MQAQAPEQKQDGNKQALIAEILRQSEEIYGLKFEVAMLECAKALESFDPKQVQRQKITLAQLEAQGIDQLSLRWSTQQELLTILKKQVIVAACLLDLQYGNTPQLQNRLSKLTDAEAFILFYDSLAIEKLNVCRSAQEEVIRGLQAELEKVTPQKKYRLVNFGKDITDQAKLAAVLLDNRDLINTLLVKLLKLTIDACDLPHIEHLLARPHSMQPQHFSKLLTRATGYNRTDIVQVITKACISTALTSAVRENNLPTVEALLPKLVIGDDVTPEVVDSLNALLKDAAHAKHEKIVELFLNYFAPILDFRGMDETEKACVCEVINKMMVADDVAENKADPFVDLSEDAFADLCQASSVKPLIQYRYALQKKQVQQDSLFDDEPVSRADLIQAYVQDKQKFMRELQKERVGIQPVLPEAPVAEVVREKYRSEVFEDWRAAAIKPIKPTLPPAIPAPGVIQDEKADGDALPKNPRSVGKALAVVGILAQRKAQFAPAGAGIAQAVENGQPKDIEELPVAPDAPPKQMPRPAALHGGDDASESKDKENCSIM